MSFCTLGPIWSPKVCLAKWGRSTHFRENRPIFQNKGFPCNPSWIMCRWTLQGRWAPPDHLRDTSHTFPASCCWLPICPVWGSIKSAAREVQHDWLRAADLFATRKMSYGAPWEQSNSEADPMPPWGRGTCHSEEGHRRRPSRAHKNV